MQRVAQRDGKVPGAADASFDCASALALAPQAAITTAETAGVRLYSRCPPVHSVILGRCRLAYAGRLESTEAVAVPAGTEHTLLALEGSHASVAYLDARRYRFEDVQALAQRWHGFQPGRDDVRELLGEALARPRRSVDPRLLRALQALETPAMDISTAARSVSLSESRLTHLVSDTLGTPPRTWRAWFKLRHAIAQTVLQSDSLTQAAHGAGFVDSAHLTRTCKQLMGVAPARVLPRSIHVSRED
jgi:AraC-like DNA-binding protein